MSYKNLLTTEKANSLLERQIELQKTPTIHNQLEALEAFGKLFVQEVEALRSNMKWHDKAVGGITEEGFDLEEEVRNYEVELIRLALFKTRGKQRSAAKMLKVKISTLNAKIKRYGISLRSVELVRR